MLNCCVNCVVAAFLTQTVSLDDATVKFEIWDTAGQGEFSPHLPSPLRLSDCSLRCAYFVHNFIFISRALPESGPYVLQGGSSGHSGLRYHQEGIPLCHIPHFI
ncbi:hypothetical protein EON63_02470 [archaeon]|nr:MAG: hypothetical protein EON63_02470 [archaeon]